MKNSTPTPNKHQFLTIDFYMQCFFFGLALIFGLLSFVSGYFMILGMFSLIPIMLYNSIGLTYHIFQGSYSKEVEIYRKIHAVSAIIYLVVFVIVFVVFEYPANDNALTLFLFWGIAPLFLVAYFFITWQDWKAMRNLNN